MKYWNRPRIRGAALYAACVVVLALTGWAVAQQDTAVPSTRPVTPENEKMLKVVGPRTYDLRYRDTDLQAVLRLLSAQTKRNIIASKDVTGKVSADLYGVTFQEALDAVLRGAGYAYLEKGKFIYVMAPDELEAIIQAERKMGCRTFRLSYVTATDAKTLIAPALSADGSVAITPAAAMGITPSETDTGANSYAAEDVLVVRDYEENLRQVADILAKLDVKPEQVEICATILRATLTENNALGIDFNTVAGIDFDAINASTAGVQNLTTGNANIADLNLAATTFRTDFNQAIDAGGMTFGLITNNIAFFIRALESVTDVTVLANPTLLVINKQRGQVMIGNRDGYLTTTVTETVATQTVQFLETGTRLVVRPFIAKNGYIRLELHPEDSSGSVQQVGQSVLPSETTTEVTSNVLVRDGHTIVIGGLFRERTSNERSQIPVIGNIPYLGALFRQTADNTTREEVIILITPRIIKQEIDEAVAEQMKDDVERFRVGQRKGLQWWGRSRLAQTHMRWAKQELEAGRRDKALWNVDMALGMVPRMEEAIRLKERLTERAYWADQSQISSVKYLIQQMVMQELGMPVQRVIPPAKPRDADKVDPAVRKALGISKRLEDPLPEPPPPPPLPIVLESDEVEVVPAEPEQAAPENE